MNRVQRYLIIPSDYASALGGLRWHPDAEAVEYAEAREREGEEAIGGTFAMAGEVALFLRGFGSADRLIGFGPVLHLLHLFGLSRPGLRLEGAGPAPQLSRLFQELGRPLRQAGALGAWLCRGMPRAVDPPEVEEVLRLLSLRSSDPESRRFTTGDSEPGEVDALAPELFEARVLALVNTLSDEELRHWLKFGREPVGDVGLEVAAGVEVETARPRGLVERLEEVSNRPRLSGSASLVPMLMGALSVPSRNREAAELLVGGLADLSSKGRPEAILPHQFALEEMEFLRRFAERELLYFHREAPRSRVDEELVVVMDQGARTWGDVRLGLAAGALALSRAAARRGTRLRLAATSQEGVLAAPEALDDEALARIFEASDLSLSPGRALERVLEEGSERPRDVVLLTHPRSVREEEVVAAARRLRAGERLFSVTVDESGAVELLELRRGNPIVLGRFRVSLPQAESESGPSKQEGQGPWRGDVEPVGFPFSMGALRPVDDQLFDFDDSGDWLLLAESERGLLHLWRTDGQAPPSMLPRAFEDGGVLKSIDSVIGVGGGFVVAGRLGRCVAVAHYDLGSRTCTLHRLPFLAVPGDAQDGLEWGYHRALHLVLVTSRQGSRWAAALDLRGERENAVHNLQGLLGLEAPERIQEAMRADLESRPSEVRYAMGAREEVVGGVRLDPISGEIEEVGGEGEVRRFVFLEDGHPALAGGKLLFARRAGRTLGLLTEARMGRRTLRLVRTPEFQPITSRRTEPDLTGFALSRDGRRFARRVGRYQIEVAEVMGPWSQFTTERGPEERKVGVMLRPGLMNIRAGDVTFLLAWMEDELKVLRGPEWVAIVGKAPVRIRAKEWRDEDLKCSQALTASAGYDRERFVEGCTSGRISALVDDVGQVSVVDAKGALVAMFLAEGERLAGWMPDGTRFGPAELTGGVETEGALERFARRLQEVQPFKPVPFDVEA